MPRTARIVAPGYPFHITQKGNYSRDIFIRKEDREIYLEWMNDYSRKYGLKHLAYCLMSNHVHFISIPEKHDSLARVFSTLNMRYSQYFNKKTGGKGLLWHGRFYSCMLGEGHLLMALRYVERNPVRANLVSKPWDWIWSSARDHTGNGSGILELEDLYEHADITLSK